MAYISDGFIGPNVTKDIKMLGIREKPMNHPMYSLYMFVSLIQKQKRLYNKPSQVSKPAIIALSLLFLGTKGISHQTDHKLHTGYSNKQNFKKKTKRKIKTNRKKKV